MYNKCKTNNNKHPISIRVPQSVSPRDHNDRST